MKKLNYQTDKAFLKGWKIGAKETQKYHSVWLFCRQMFQFSSRILIWNFLSFHGNQIDVRWKPKDELLNLCNLFKFINSKCAPTNLCENTQTRIEWSSSLGDIWGHYLFWSDNGNIKRRDSSDRRKQKFFSGKLKFEKRTIHNDGSLFVWCT